MHSKLLPVIIKKVVKAECTACGGLHCENKGNKGFEYINCKEFRKMTSQERLNKLKKDKICFQCLQPNHQYNNDEFSKGFHGLVCQ